MALALLVVALLVVWSVHQRRCARRATMPMALALMGRVVVVCLGTSLSQPPIPAPTVWTTAWLVALLRTATSADPQKPP